MKKLTKFYVKVNPQTSKILQEVAFKNGYLWGDDTKEVSHVKSHFLYFNSHKDNRFWQDSKDTPVYGQKAVSLEKAIELLTVGNKIRFDSLKQGEWFHFEDSLFLKTNQSYDDVGNSCGCATRIDGEEWYFKKEELVVPTKITVKEEK